jgi:hypothetical protein
MTKTAWVSILALAMMVLAACGPKPAAPAGIELAPVSALPSDVRSAPIKVQEAYRFALANPEILKQIPCYCGCGAVGHTSNYDCYVAGMDEAGGVVFDYHAYG